MGHGLLTTRWEGTQLVVRRNHEVVDRIPAAGIERVILVCDAGDTPADLAFAVIETAADHVLLPAASGIAARVYFERQPYWTERSCIYWVTGRHVPLPRRLCTGLWLLRSHRPAFLRMPASELAPLIEQWPLQGPQTWEQRRWSRQASGRRLASAAGNSAPRAS